MVKHSMESGGRRRVLWEEGGLVELEVELAVFEWG
jgi:hypothetical protein